MSDDRIAEMIAQSNAALVATLVGALQGIRAPFAPSLKLCRFTGYPERDGDPAVAEWLHEFDMYARQTGVKDAGRAVVLLYHLCGRAREEVLCQPERVRQDCKALVSLRLLRFGPPDTVHLLSTAFHARMQLDSESLADYSRVLMQLHNRMERAAASEAESSALVILRDTALKEQFVQGVREQSVRQELRRIAFHSVGKSFHHMRDEALYLFQEHDERTRTVQVRGAEVGEEGYRDEKVPVHTRCQDMDSPSQMMQAHQQLQAHVMQLSSQQNEIAHQLRAVLDKFPQGHVARPISVPANMPNHRDGLCFVCKHKGHVIRDCRRKRELNVIQSHNNSCDAEKHVKELQDENDQMKETLEKMKNTSVSDLNKRETKWERERDQLTFDLQRTYNDARELNMQLTTLTAKSPEVVTRIKRVEVESATCKLALEKCSASLDQSRNETRCLQSQLKAL